MSNRDFHVGKMMPILGMILKSRGMSYLQIPVKNSIDLWVGAERNGA